MGDRFSGSMDPARNVFTITPGSTTISPRPKAMWANSAGTITVVGDDDHPEDIVVAVAGPVDFSPKKVTAWTGTADALKGLWG